MSEQRGYRNNRAKKAIMTDRLDLYLSSRRDRQLEYMSKDTGNQPLSSDQPALRDHITCVLLMDGNIDKTDVTSWTRRNLRTVLTYPWDMMVLSYVKHQSAVHHTMTLYTHLTTLMTCPNPSLTEPDMDAR